MKNKKSFVRNGVGTILPEISEMLREGVRQRNENPSSYDHILDKIADKENHMKKKLSTVICVLKFLFVVFITTNIGIGIAIFVDSIF